MFRPLKKKIASKRFARDADVKQAVTSCLQTRYTDFFHGLIKGLVPRLVKILNVSGDYVWCVPCATHVLSVHQGHGDVLGIRLFVSIFFKTSLYLQTPDN